MPTAVWVIVQAEKTLISIIFSLQIPWPLGLQFGGWGRTTRDDHALYVAAQCTTDLSKADCNKCLSKASNRMRSCCTQKTSFEGRVHSTNCILWYTHVSFFNPPIVTNPEEYCN
ncbi:putative Gnk2-like domain-containing protein [Helianthus anomalus]